MNPTEAQKERTKRLDTGYPWVQLGRIKAAMEILQGMDVRPFTREEKDLLSRCRAAGNELRDALDGRLGDGQ